jgi:hypothetical protein
MGFSRKLLPDPLPTGDELDAMLAGIGCAVAATPLRDANIEDALMGALAAGMEADDLRRLGLAVQWIAQHARAINVDRLVRAVPGLPGLRTRACWAAIARWQQADRRWRRLAVPQALIDLLRVGNAFQLQRRGPDPRFADTPLRVPAGTLRERPGDVMEPAALAQWHRGYRHRILLGPSYRADMWAIAEREPTTSASVLARRAYGSFATAWQVREDLAVLNGKSSANAVDLAT